MVKGINVSSRRHRCNLIHLYGRSHPFVTLVPGDPVPSSGGYAGIWCTNLRAGKNLKHIKIKIAHPEMISLTAVISWEQACSLQQTTLKKQA